MDDLINCGYFFFFLFLWTFSGLDIPGAAGAITISISLIGISLSRVLVVHIPHEFLSSGSSPSNSVWHRREQRNYIMLQLLFILYIHVSSFVQLIIWGGICRFYISFSCILTVLTIRLISIYT